MRIWHCVVPLFAVIVAVACSDDTESSASNPGGGKGGSGQAGGGTGASTGSSSGGGSGGWTGKDFVDGPPLSYPNQPQKHEAVHLVSPRHLVVRLDDKTKPGGSTDAWTLSSEQDDSYGAGQAPSAVAVKARAAALIPEGWPLPAIVEYEVVLSLPTALKAGASYGLEWKAGGGKWTIDVAADKLWSPAIKVNQIGYRPGATARYAYVSYWLGSLPPLALGDGEMSFRLYDATSDAEVAAGALTLRQKHDEKTDDAYKTNYTLANVYEADLAALSKPGLYYLVWDGVGRSPTFAVADDVYAIPFVTAFRGLYHHRCGVALEAQHTKWAHAKCHTAQAEHSDTDINVSGGDAFAALSKNANGKKSDATGGYHDAGDYDRRTSHLVVVDAVVDLFEMFPDVLARDDLGLPESGNSIPDLIDEAAFALDLYGQLQEDDGGVHAGIETTDYPGWEVMPEDDTTTEWYVYAVDPVATYRFAGAAAKLARVLEAFDATAAGAWLDRAKKAWTWAEANRPTKYGTKSQDAYAAAELLKTTGEASYGEAFVAYSPFAGGKLDYTYSAFGGEFQEVVPAFWAAATAPAADEAVRQASRRVLIEGADNWIAAAKQVGFRIVKSPWAPVGFGSITTPKGSGLLFRVHHLSGDDEYLQWGNLGCDVTLGTNQTGYSYVTGLGWRAVEKPLNTPSLADGIDPAVPGITVYGPSRTTESKGIHGSVLGVYAPPVQQWPLAERFVDVSYVPALNEYTVTESIAPSTFAFGYLAGIGAGK